MAFRAEIWACILWLISSLFILTSVIGNLLYPVLANFWDFANSVSFFFVTIALFVFSIGLSTKDKGLSHLALIASISTLVLSTFIIMLDPTVFTGTNYFLIAVTLISMFSIALFLIYLSHWIFVSRYNWKVEKPALLAIILNVILAFFLFTENLAAFTFFEMNMSYIIAIIAMIANICLFRKIKIEEE